MPDGGTSGSCASIPEEAAGPYPGDGSNGPNALAFFDGATLETPAVAGGHDGRRAAAPLHQLCGIASAFRASSTLIGSRPMSRAIRTAFSTSGPFPFAISVPAASR